MFKYPLGILLATLTAVAVAAPSAIAFETYKVTGVKPGDTLTMREQPVDGGKPSEWKELGRIPADAETVLGTGRSLKVGEQRWAEVSFSGTMGWVNAVFLAAHGDPADLKDETFQCGGTEPFWGVTLGPKGATYSDPEEQLEMTIERVQPSTARLFPLLYRLKDAKGRSYRATVTQRDECTDGMSDFEYGFEVLLSGDDNFEQGCCFLKR